MVKAKRIKETGSNVQKLYNPITNSSNDISPEPSESKIEKVLIANRDF